MQKVLEFDQLISPIESNNPVGINLRSSGDENADYYQLKEMRMQARAIERQMSQGLEKETKPNWLQIHQLAERILTEQSKDLEVACWLVEALLRQDHFLGLAVGFRLLGKLIELYWEEIYPLPDEDGVVTRLAPLIGLNGEETDGTLIVPLALIPLTQGKTLGPFALWQYQQAQEQKQRQTMSGVSLEQIMLAVNETSPAFFIELRENIQGAISEYQKLTAILEEKCIADAPPSSRILSQLTACLDCVTSITKGIDVDTAISLQEQIDLTEKKFLPEENSSLNSNKMNFSSAREDVLRTLLTAAVYFRQTEPHSPLSYMIERVVQWARLSLPELLREMIKDEQSWGHICHLTGIHS